MERKVKDNKRTNIQQKKKPTIKPKFVSLKQVTHCGNANQTTVTYYFTSIRLAI